MDVLHKELSHKIIRCFYNVYNELGFGFLEKIYEKALIRELDLNGLSYSTQTQLKVFYKGEELGNYYADLIVEDKVIIELKAVEALHELHELQLLNYLKATDIELGYLLNFGKTPEFKRKILTQKFRKKLQYP